MSMQLRSQGFRGGIDGLQKEANFPGGALAAETLREVNGGPSPACNVGQIGQSGEGEETVGVVEAEP